MMETGELIQLQCMTQRNEGPPFTNIFVSDHSADTNSPHVLRQLYRGIQSDGFHSVRFDWGMRNVLPQRKDSDPLLQRRYSQATEIMGQEGLGSPIIIFSRLPSWALELYKKDKAGFFSVWRTYVNSVGESMSKQGQQIQNVQLLNELNHFGYTRISIADFPELCRQTRESLKPFSSDVKLIGSVIAGNVVESFSRRVLHKDKNVITTLEILRQQKMQQISVGEKGYFDTILVDYYPGIWHIPLQELGIEFKDFTRQMLRRNASFFMELSEKMAQELSLLKSIFSQMATWTDYGLGEVGHPTNWIWNEKVQRVFFEKFAQAFHSDIIISFQENATPLPSMIGLYSAVDDIPKTWVGKSARVITPFPEFDFGMRTSNGKSKEVVSELPGIISSLTR